jgi:hypothetical protein
MEKLKWALTIGATGMEEDLEGQEHWGVRAKQE